ncbi:flagellar FliJ protein [Clostridium sp. USBA 49]|uniref:flagellar export protein FliJ n=1 Tax=Clostridium TaxID=1485 RepID=UPI00099ACDE4|nr:MULTISPECIES: flagellar export protein FliJ [Clostridium]SKA72682.1 flagellar FliJ protein [Clostridium sp. USBA 49]
MKGFNFRLQKLLDIRKDMEEESKRLFREAQIEKEKVEERLKNLKENYNKHNKSSSKDTLVEKKIKNIYLNSLNKAIMETNLELQNKAQKLEEMREELKKRQIERKTVETLKEKKLKIFIRQQNLIEQKSIDEFALYAFIRNRERR